jgi:hypothetical protein
MTTNGSECVDAVRCTVLSADQDEVLVNVDDDDDDVGVGVDDDNDDVDVDVDVDGLAAGELLMMVDAVDTGGSEMETRICNCK